MTTFIDDPALAATAADMLKAVAHPLRLRILGLLAREPHNVGELAAALDAAQPAVSQQLRILRSFQLVGVDRAGGYATYWLAEPKVKNLLMCVSGCLGTEEDVFHGDESATVPENRRRDSRRRRAG